MDWTSPYVPKPHQARFHALPHDEALFLAGVGAGKTLTGVHEAVFLAQDNPDCDGAIVSHSQSFRWTRRQFMYVHRLHTGHQFSTGFRIGE
jgi:hypothetical protein